MTGKKANTNEWGSREWQGPQPSLPPSGSKKCTAHALGIHFRAHEVPGGRQDQSAWLHHGHITPGQPGRLLCRNSCLWRQGDSSKYCLSCLWNVFWCGVPRDSFESWGNAGGVKEREDGLEVGSAAGLKGGNQWLNVQVAQCSKKSIPRSIGGVSIVRYVHHWSRMMSQRAPSAILWMALNSVLGRRRQCWMVEQQKGWASRNFMKLKEKSRVQRLGQNNPRHQHRLGTNLPGSTQYINLTPPPTPFIYCMFLSCIDYVLQLPNGWLAIEKMEYSWSCKDDRQGSQVLANSGYKKRGSLRQGWVSAGADAQGSWGITILGGGGETQLYTATVSSECLRLPLSLALFGMDDLQRSFPTRIFLLLWSG